ncbi:SUMO ligase siz1 [Nowakowskiella sp. JEL0407]|nr:SUMO ligase siz1 [Nowakowskiella sp. JEL0407]
MEEVTDDNQLIKYIETYIHTLKIAQLKDLLREVGERVSGNKPDLVGRLNRYLASLTPPTWNNRTKLYSYSSSFFKMLNRQCPPFVLQHLQSTTTQEQPQQTQKPSNTIPSVQNTVPPPLSVGLSQSINFKRSPFYVLDERVSNVNTLDWKTSVNNRVLRFEFTVSQTQAARLTETMNNPPTNPHQYRLYLFSATPENLNPKMSKVEYPSGVQFTLNGEQFPPALAAKCKGTQKRPWTAKPVDITDYCKLKSGSKNRVDVTWHGLDGKKFWIFVHLVKKLSIRNIASSLRETKFLSKETIISKLKERAGPLDEDLVATSTTVSLRDPYSRLRIVIPARSNSCSHVQCYDCETFLSMMESVPTWICPVCNSSITWESIFVDGYFQDMLDNAPPDTEQIEIDPDFVWSVAMTDEKEKVTLDDPPETTTEVVELIQVDQSSARSSSTHPENNSNVIDLTLDSDDDEEVTSNTTPSTSTKTTAVAPANMTTVTPTNAKPSSVFQTNANATAPTNSNAVVTTNPNIIAPTNLSAVAPTNTNGIAPARATTVLPAITNAISHTKAIAVAQTVQPRESMSIVVTPVQPTSIPHNVSNSVANSLNRPKTPQISPVNSGKNSPISSRTNVPIPFNMEVGNPRPPLTLPSTSGAPISSESPRRITLPQPPNFLNHPANLALHPAMLSNLPNQIVNHPMAQTIPMNVESVDSTKKGTSIPSNMYVSPAMFMDPNHPLAYIVSTLPLAANGLVEATNRENETTQSGPTQTILDRFLVVDGSPNRSTSSTSSTDQSAKRGNTYEDSGQKRTRVE